MIHEPDLCSDDGRFEDGRFQDSAADALLARSVEQLVGDAYDAPTVPASLLQRLDRQIAQEWGHSPGLVSTRATRWHRSLTARAPWINLAKIAVCAVLAVAAFTF